MGMLTTFFIVLAFVAATLRPERRVGILWSAVVLAVLINYSHIGKHFWEYISIPVLILVVALELFSNIIFRTGLIDFIASKLISRIKSPEKIFLSLLLITYLLSLFMNNLAAIVLIVPLSLRITSLIGEEHTEQILIFEVIMSNLGGASLLISDFPNMLISDYTGTGFVGFFSNLGVFIAIALLPLTLIFFWATLPKKVSINLEKRLEIEATRIIFDLGTKNPKWKIAIPCLILFSILILSFLIFNTFFQIEPAFIAIIFAIILVFLSHYGENVLNTIDFKTLLTFAGLFILAGIIGEQNLVKSLGDKLITMSPDNAIFALMWTVGLFTAFLSAGPTTATFLQFAEKINLQANENLVWWALSLGVLAGSSATIFGATAGPVTAGLYEKFAGKRFPFVRFLKYGAIMFIMYLTLSSLYLLFRIRVH